MSSTYTESQAQVGRGSIVSIGGAVGSSTASTMVPIFELNDTSLDGQEWGTVDASNFQSNLWEEFKTTMLTGGNVNLAGNRVSSDAGQIALVNAFKTGKLYPFEVTFPLRDDQSTADMATFNALVISRATSIKLKDIITITVKLKISGEYDETPGTETPAS